MRQLGLLLLLVASWACAADNTLIIKPGGTQEYQGPVLPATCANLAVSQPTVTGTTNETPTATSCALPALETGQIYYVTGNIVVDLVATHSLTYKVKVGQVTCSTGAMVPTTPVTGSLDLWVTVQSATGTTRVRCDGWFRFDDGTSKRIASQTLGATLTGNQTLTTTFQLSDGGDDATELWTLVQRIR